MTLARGADPLSTVGVDDEVALELLDELVALLEGGSVAWVVLVIRFLFHPHIGAPLPNLPTATRLGDD